MAQALIVGFVMTSGIYTADWEQVAPLPAPNGGFICGARGGRVIVVGGTNWAGGSKNWLRDEHEFDPATMKWRTVRTLGHPIAYGLAVQRGDEFSVIGGSDGVQPLRTIPGLPAEVVLSSGGLVDGKIVVVGGMDDAANLAGMSVGTYVVDGNSVTRMADYPGKPFATAASAVLAAELFVFGGVNFDSSTKLPVNTSAAFAFSLSKNSWRTLRPLPTPRRGISALALDENRIYVAGGYIDAFTPEAFLYDIRTNEFRSAKPLPYAGMVGLVKLDQFVYCLGGEDNMKSRTDKCYRIAIGELLK